MKEKELCSILDHTLQCIYFLVHKTTKKIAYLNDVGCDLLQMTQDSYESLTRDELLYHGEVLDDDWDLSALSSNVFREYTIEHDILHKAPCRYRAMVVCEEGEYVLELAFSEQQQLPPVLELSPKPSFDQGMLHCVNLLLRENVINDSLQQIVNETAHFYCSLQSCLLEIDRKSLSFYQSFSSDTHCDTLKKAGIFHNAPADIFAQWSSLLLQEKIIHIKNVKKEVNSDTLLYRILKNNEVTSLFIAPIMQEGELVAILVVENPYVRDIDLRFICSVRLFFQEAIQKRSMHSELVNIYDRDTLTGFYNHKKYDEALELLLVEPPKTLGIVFIDLRSMKDKSEESGYIFDDNTIKQASAVMESFFQEPFYRIDAFHFVCFVPDCIKEQFEQQVNSLRIETLSNEKNSFCVGSSWDTGDDNLFTQIQELDHLMRQDAEEAKKRNSLNKDNLEVTIQKDLLNAIESQEFDVYFQPKVHFKTKKVVGAEAVARRKVSTDEAMLHPTNIVKLFEDQAIIRHLDLYVVEHVCKTIATWLAYGIEIPVSVNFSRVTLTEFGIVNTICEICDIYGVPYHLLVIEFTERVAMMNEKAYQHIAEELEQAGFLLALDNFGVAYSNLVTLAKININEIKIDRSLIKNMEDNHKNQVILKNIIEMCNLMESIAPLAEGVETEVQALKLEEFGCIYGQGNYFSPPISSEEFYQQFLAR